MKVYYEDYRLKITEDNGKYNIYDQKFKRITYKEVSKEKADSFINKVLSKRNKRKE